jgi:osmotically-inducible protein OsmY
VAERRGASLSRDAEVQRAVEEALRWEPELRAADVAVSGAGGVITLAGFVHSYTQKLAALRAAARVTEARVLVDAIDVRRPGVDPRPDSELAREAVASIRRELPLARERIRVRVEEGWLTVEGELELDGQRGRVERAARRVRGLQGLRNEIRVGRGEGSTGRDAEPRPPSR